MRKKQMVVAGFILVAGLLLPGQVQAAATKITIEGRKKIEVGEMTELDAEIFPDDDFVKDSDIAWKSSKPSVIKVIHQKGEDVFVKGKKTGTAKITVRIKGTNISAVKKMKVTKASGQTAANKDKKKLKKWEQEVQSVRREIEGESVGSSYEENRALFYAYKAKLDRVEEKIDDLEGKWENRYGKKARKMKDAIEAVEDALEEAEESMERKFGDFD
ncbi:MAG: Ig-like domain-containing protein [Eubacteriales bacterium]|nr:Ig-like domain-containing protein [Eubacteriales bacterium]